MNQSIFLKLVRGGEKSNVDFKLTCNAFNRSAGDQDKAKAELVKDICAMANNGPSTSYLIIGVGDDRRTILSVTDSNLNSQNIQTLVRDSIHPRPAVRFHRVKWPKAPMPFRGVDFIVIQIGPNARQAFRLARDMINWPSKFHFRKHEVWVRNEDTSDLATPEQIAQLLSVRRMAQSEPEPTFTVVEYQKLALVDQLPALALDIKSVFTEMGGRIAMLPSTDRKLPEDRGHFRVCLKIRGKFFVFRCVLVERLTSQSDRHFGMPNCWLCEHGVIVFVIGSASDAGKFGWLSVDSKAKWGTLGILTPKKHGWFSRSLPDGFTDAPFSILTIPKLSDTKHLRRSLGLLFEELENDETLFNHLNNARSAMNAELRRWSLKSPSALAKSFPVYATEISATFRRQVLAMIKLTKAP